MPNPSRQTAPVTWADLVHIQDTHGIRPTGTEPAKQSRLLHTVYMAWEEGQGIKAGRGYLMPIHLLIGHLRLHLRASGHPLPTPDLQALIVDALNHRASGLTIELRPFRRQAA